MWSEYVVPVPGQFDAGVAFLDLETQKVPCDYRMANGEILRQRWSVLMAGVARDGRVRLFERTEEAELLAAVAEAVAGGPIVYAAPREFDEMILRGRFTNARRAHASAPFFPAMPGAESVRWRNVRRDLVSADRAPDVPSREVPARVEDGRDYELVLVHLLRDVVELLLAAGNPDAECDAWCRRVLAITAFASEAVFSGEP